MSAKGGKWSLTDIADQTQLGSPARLATNRRMIQSSSSQGHKDDTIKRLEQQLQEFRSREEELQRRAEELQTQGQDSNRRAGASNRRAEELQTQVQDANRRAEEMQTQVNDANRRAEASNRRAEASNRRAGEMQTQVDDAERRAVAANRRAEASNTRAGELQTQVQDAEDRVQDLLRSLADTTQELRQCEDHLQANSTHWVVRREDIELTGPELGVGGWATVSVAKFRGIQVAVKRIHNQIISHHNLQLFQREMNMAARLRIPTLSSLLEPQWREK